MTQGRAQSAPLLICARVFADDLALSFKKKRTNLHAHK